MDRRKQMFAAVLLITVCVGVGVYVTRGSSSNSEKAKHGPLKSGEVAELVESVGIPVTMRRVPTNDPDLLEAIIGRASQQDVEMNFGFIIRRPGSRGLTNRAERKWIAKVPNAVLISGCGNVTMIEPALTRERGEPRADTALRGNMYAQIKRAVCDAVYGPDSSYAL